MYYYKLIILIFLLFLLIFINISFGRKCKCPKDERDSRRYKRGVGCSCLGGGEKGYNSDKERKRKGKGLMIEENEEEEISGDEEIEDSESFTENYGEGSNYGEIEEIKALKRVLLICNDFYYSPLNFYKLIANILSEKYQVDMLVYTKEERVKYSRVTNLQIIYIPINRTRFDQNEIKMELERFITSNEHFFVGIYKEIITNQIVYIGNEYVGIYNYLKKQNYSFGIAEFSSMAGAFAVFNELKIKNTFNVSTSVFFPKYLQFLINNEGNPIDVTHFNIPEFTTALPGDWGEGAEIWQRGSERYEENINNHKEINEVAKNNFKTNYLNYYNNLFNEENIYLNKKPSNFIQLFKNIKYHFVNQHPLGKFKTFPLNKKIVYIGGIHVEENKDLNINIKTINNNERSCVVLVSFGTVTISGGLEIEDVEMMFNNFSNFEDCTFKVRISREDVPEQYSDNIQITEEFLDQQKILFEENTKLFISHCGQHSLTEAMYAGVPLLCIPHVSDQMYNSSIVEHLNIGKYVNLQMMEEFPNSLNILMEEGNIYRKNVLNLRKRILNGLKKRKSRKKQFLGNISKIIGGN